MIERVLRGIDAFSRPGAYLSALSMMLIVGLISVEIVCRSAFNTSTLVADEFSGYLMVVVMAGLGPRGRPILEVFATGLTLALSLFVRHHASLMVFDSYIYDIRTDSISATSLWIPLFIVLLGLARLVLQLLAFLVRRLNACSAIPCLSASCSSRFC